MAKKEREVERLKKQVASLEQSLKDCGKESGDLIKELEKGHENLERDLRHVHTALEESHRTRDQLLVRNKQLEGDMKTLRRDFNRKVAEVVNGQKTQRNSVDYSQVRLFLLVDKVLLTLLFSLGSGRFGVRIPLATGFFRVESYHWHKNWHSQWLSCQAPGFIESALGLVGPVSVYCDWMR